MTPLLACQGITKRYGAILANDRVDFDVNHGEIHALVGENGAGKSTLVGCIYGLVEPDEGEVRVDGIPAAIRHPKDALALGIGLVQQHFVLVPPLSVAENIVLGAEPRWGIDFDRRKAEQDVADLCEKFGLDLDPSEKVERLSVGERQRVEIAKVLYRKAQILILDEPTAVLTPHESRSLLENLVRLKEQGLAVVLITHRIPETLSVADRVTVMRRGRVVLCREIKDLSAEQLAEAIVGESLSHPVGARGTYGGSLVEIHELDTVSGTRGLALKGISLSLREGEVLGIAGVSGNGQQELVDALLGLLPITSGTYTLGGKSLVGRSTGEIRRKGVACILQDRQSQGLLLGSSITENLFLGRSLPEERWGWVSKEARNESARERIVSYEIAAPGPETPVAALSGGHQQRVVAARELGSLPRFLIAHDPTRGLDVRAAARVRQMLIRSSVSGAAVLLISSDLDEILTLADRVAVLYDGRIRAIYGTEEVSAEELGRAMTGA